MLRNVPSQALKNNKKDAELQMQVNEAVAKLLKSKESLEEFEKRPVVYTCACCLVQLLVTRSCVLICYWAQAPCSNGMQIQSMTSPICISATPLPILYKCHCNTIVRAPVQPFCSP
jgi:hypothetical protein